MYHPSGPHNQQSVCHLSGGHHLGLPLLRMADPQREGIVLSQTQVWSRNPGPHQKASRPHELDENEKKLYNVLRPSQYKIRYSIYHDFHYKDQEWGGDGTLPKIPKIETRYLLCWDDPSLAYFTMEIGPGLAKRHWNLKAVYRYVDRFLKLNRPLELIFWTTVQLLYHDI